MEDSIIGHNFERERPKDNLYLIWYSAFRREDAFSELHPLLKQHTSWCYRNGNFSYLLKLNSCFSVDQIDLYSMFV
jgi:hypothetical protein